MKKIWLIFAFSIAFNGCINNVLSEANKFNDCFKKHAILSSNHPIYKDSAMVPFFDLYSQPGRVKKATTLNYSIKGHDYNLPFIISFFQLNISRNIFINELIQNKRIKPCSIKITRVDDCYSAYQDIRPPDDVPDEKQQLVMMLFLKDDIMISFMLGPIPNMIQDKIIYSKICDCL